MLTITLTEQKFVFFQSFELKFTIGIEAWLLCQWWLAFQRTLASGAQSCLEVFSSVWNFWTHASMVFLYYRKKYCTIVQCTLYSVHCSLIRIILSRDWVGEEEQVAHRSLLHQLVSPTQLIQDVPKKWLREKNHNQNWALWSQILPCTWLGRSWFGLVLVRNDQKIDFQAQAVSATGDWASALWVP